MYEYNGIGLQYYHHDVESMGFHGYFCEPILSMWYLGMVLQRLAPGYVVGHYWLLRGVVAKHHESLLRRAYIRATCPSQLSFRLAV